MYKGLLTFLIAVMAAKAAGPCGFMRLMENHAIRVAGGPIALSAKTDCAPEKLYDSVQVYLTSHFRIYYTLSGPHAVSPASNPGQIPPYIDTLARHLENAWSLHTVTEGMAAPAPMVQTWHYRRSDHPTLYPVEVIDLTLMRGVESILGSFTEGLYGLTYPGDSDDPTRTQLMVENDFRYAGSGDSTVQLPDRSCSYTYPGTPVTFGATDYSQEWEKGLQVTAYHELYHGSQLRYLDFRDHPTFWFEASAVGAEEIGAADVNDYLQYLPSVFAKPGASITNRRSLYPYGQAPLYLYLYNKLGPRTDAEIWKNYASHPDDDFPLQWQRLASGLKRNADSLFHDFALAQLFSGNRAYLSPTVPFANDQVRWPTWTVHNFGNTPAPDTAAFDYVRHAPGDPMPIVCAGCRNSAVLWRSDSSQATIHAWQDSLEFAAIPWASADSAMLVVSRLRSDSATSTVTGSIRAWPNPWNPVRPVCFGPLTIHDQGIEVRTADGLVVARLARNGDRACWDGNADAGKIAPGVLHWRTLPRGKNQVLLVIF